jgi:hypothetical protein
MTLSRKQAAGLFEFDEQPPLYATLHDELIAVSQRRKGVSIFEVAADDETEGQQFEAQARYLSLVTERRRMTVWSMPIWKIFAFRPDEEWRIEAYLNFLTARSFQWSDAAEFFKSSLAFGYTEEQAVGWIRANDRRQASWNGLTVFLTMPEKLKAATLDLYARILPSGEEESMSVFYPNTWKLVMRRDAEALSGPDAHIARVSVMSGSVASRFRSEMTRTSDHDDILFKRGSRTLISLINQNTTSAIKFLSKGEWK